MKKAAIGVAAFLGICTLAKRYMANTSLYLPDNSSTTFLYRDWIKMFWSRLIVPATTRETVSGSPRRALSVRTNKNKNRVIRVKQPASHDKKAGLISSPKLKAMCWGTVVAIRP